MLQKFHATKSKNKLISVQETYEIHAQFFGKSSFHKLPAHFCRIWYQPCKALARKAEMGREPSIRSLCFPKVRTNPSGFTPGSRICKQERAPQATALGIRSWRPPMGSRLPITAPGRGRPATPSPTSSVVPSSNTVLFISCMVSDLCWGLAPACI